MLRRQLFITGTDTGVGKTLVSALLSAAIKDLGHGVKYFKPVQTGSDLDDDTKTVRDLSGLLESEVYPPVYKFKAPLSPDRAAARENTSVEYNKILKSFSELHSGDDFLVVEGAGGVEVPLTEKEKFSDLMRALQMPVVLVARTQLGTINHTLLSAKRLQALGIPFLGLILSGPQDPGLGEIFEREGIPVLLEIPYINSIDTEWVGLKNKMSSAVQTWLDSAEEKSSQKDQVADIDGKYIWHPYTQHGRDSSFPEIQSARGMELFLKDGRVLLDAVSSWWVNLHGHSHPVIAQAIAMAFIKCLRL